MAHTVPQKCFSHAWTLLPCGCSRIVTIPSGCCSGILGKPLSAVASKDSPEGKDAPVISSCLWMAGSIPRPRGNPGAHLWSSGLPWHPWAEFSQGELSRHTQVPGSIGPATSWLGQQLDVGAAIPSHHTHYSGTTSACGPAP